MVWIGFAFSIVAGRSTIDNPLFNIINCAGYVVNYLAIGRWDYSRNNNLVYFIFFYCPPRQVAGSHPLVLPPIFF